MTLKETLLAIALLLIIGLLIPVLIDTNSNQYSSKSSCPANDPLGLHTHCNPGKTTENPAGI